MYRRLGNASRRGGGGGAGGGVGCRRPCLEEGECRAAPSCPPAAGRVWKWENIVQGKEASGGRGGVGLLSRRLAFPSRASRQRLSVCLPRRGRVQAAGARGKPEFMSGDRAPYFCPLRWGIILLNYDCLLITSVNFVE